MEVKSSEDKQAFALLRRSFNPSEWRSKLVNAVLPVLAVGMAKAMVGQMLSLGVDIRRKVKKRGRKGGQGSGNFGHGGRPGEVGGSSDGGGGEFVPVKVESTPGEFDGKYHVEDRGFTSKGEANSYAKQLNKALENQNKPLPHFTEWLEMDER